MRSIKFIGALALAVFIVVFATTAFACTLNSECDDNNFCTLDYCDVGGTNLCVNDAAPQDGAGCDDNNACTTGDACASGICSGTISPNGTGCADTNLCNGNETCQSGVCTAGTPPADGTSCNDNNLCTTTDVCTSGTCAGTAKNCDLGNSCKIYGTCNPASGNCSVATNKPNGTSCDDNNACTLSDVCASGTCSGTVKDCGDSNVCTIDTCDTVTGACSNAPTGSGICGLTGNPLTAMTKLKITQGVGSATNTPCSVGSCFSMEVAPGNVTWTDFGPGTDLGIVVGKSQASGGQEAGPSGAITTPGELSAAWSFFNAYGTFFTAPGGDTKNIYDSAPCMGADCIYKTELKVFNVAWNGNIIPMGSDAGCSHANCTDEQKNGIFVNDYQIDLVDGGAWSMFHAQVVPSGSFTGVKFQALMRGTVELVNPCTENNVICNDGNPCTDDVCDTTTGLCAFTPNTAACDDGDACTSGDYCSNKTCQPGATIVANCIPTAPTLVYPLDGQTGVGRTMEFRWKQSTDPENAPLTYKLYYCTTPDVEGCAPVTVASRNSKGVFYAGGAGLFMIGMTFFGGRTGRKRIALLLIILVLFAGGTLISCTKSSDDTEVWPVPEGQANYAASGLSGNTTYYWKVVADNGKIGGTKESAVQSFTTE